MGGKKKDNLISIIVKNVSNPPAAESSSMGLVVGISGEGEKNCEMSKNVMKSNYEEEISKECDRMIKSIRLGLPQ